MDLLLSLVFKRETKLRNNTAYNWGNNGSSVVSVRQGIIIGSWILPLESASDESLYHME
ncbi:hypothetical protein P5673_021174 [Acropora cervicornis]|uniref:Uncharacterized protein n=1 Tax=Acropora cervicornis TaxID=6130 RepID=A0AAD9Q934_ACRCE|nr:hypothetical protein P5673_021174 [Acropora cervicornis]